MNESVPPLISQNRRRLSSFFGPSGKLVKKLGEVALGAQLLPAGFMKLKSRILQTDQVLVARWDKADQAPAFAVTPGLCFELIGFQFSFDAPVRIVG